MSEANWIKKTQENCNMMLWDLFKNKEGKQLAAKKVRKRAAKPYI